MQQKRDPLPGSFHIEGATGKSPDGTTWVEIVYKPESGWRWYLKPTANKGPDSSICFAYFQCTETNVLLPQDCKSWHVNTDDGFKSQSTTVGLASSLALPSSLTTSYEEGLKIVKERLDARRAEVR